MLPKWIYSCSLFVIDALILSCLTEFASLSLRVLSLSFDCINCALRWSRSALDALLWAYRLDCNSSIARYADYVLSFLIYCALSLFSCKRFYLSSSTSRRFNSFSSFVFAAISALVFLSYRFFWLFSCFATPLFSASILCFINAI